MITSLIKPQKTPPFRNRYLPKVKKLQKDHQYFKKIYKFVG